ncbi:MAG: hypothetical protein IPK07_29600 [Deltaproteobacteria bacterium]|nr:hypothetical protein [Deltaproteobacteria bacterium]
MLTRIWIKRGVATTVFLVTCSRQPPASTTTTGSNMQPLPPTENALVLRTDFTNQKTWELVRSEIEADSTAGFRAYVEFLDDPQYANASIDQIRGLALNQQAHSFLMIVDHEALTRDDHAFLVIGLREWNSQYVFRVIPDEAWNIENNVSLGNAGLEDYFDDLDGSGTFRGH